MYLSIKNKNVCVLNALVSHQPEYNIFDYIHFLGSKCNPTYYFVTNTTIPISVKPAGIH